MYGVLAIKDGADFFGFLLQVHGGLWACYNGWGCLSY